MNDLDDIPRITSLKELLNEIAWSWSYPSHDFVKDGESYHLNKLTIEPDQVSYKEHVYFLAPGVYEEFEDLIAILNRANEISSD